MKIYKTQQEVDADLIDGNLTVAENVKFECPVVVKNAISVSGSIEAGWSIEAGGSIRAGEDWGIYCGIKTRISEKSKYAFVTSRETPKNLLLGEFKKL